MSENKIYIEKSKVLKAVEALRPSRLFYDSEIEFKAAMRIFNTVKNRIGHAKSTKAADKEDVRAAAKTVRSWCASKGEYCNGCPFAVKFEGMKHPDCILCDCFPARWNLGEVLADE